MPPHVVGPVQVQSPLDPLGGLSKFQRHVGRRRIFVQTDGGDVLDVELDRADTAGKVKKAVQVALALPTEQSNLVFGGHVLEDLSEVRKDSPVLLTREISRSCSSPCLSPSVDMPRTSTNLNKPIEVVGGVSCSPHLKRLLREASKALEAGVKPVPATGGLGGAYYFKNRRGESIAIVKPTDEEPFAPNNPNGYVGRSLGQPGLKRAIRVGEAGVREVAAYLLDHNKFASVPYTALVKVTSPVFNVNDDSVKGTRDGPPAKIGSFQQYVKHDFDASEHGTSRFPVSAIHRIGILDIRLFNTDRHSGNILVRKVVDEDREKGMEWHGSQRYGDDAVELIPIDHGFCLPETLESAYFEWLHWPQASLPFAAEEMEYIKEINVDREVEMLRSELPGLGEACLRVLVLSTTLLKRAASIGFTLAEIGAMMSRELRGMDEEPSELEMICYRARQQLECALRKPEEVSLSESSPPSRDLDVEDDDFQEQFEFDLEQEDDCSSVVTITEKQAHSMGELPGAYLAGTSPNGWDSETMHLNLVGQESVTSSPHPFMSPLLRLEESRALSVMDCSSSSGRASMDLISRTEVPSPRLTHSSYVPAFPCRALNFVRNVHSPPSSIRRAPSISVYRSAHSICSRFYLSGSSRGGSAFSNEEELKRAFPKDGALVFGEMSDQTWNLYRNIVEGLLDEALARRKELNSLSAKRFGTSCKF